MIAVDCSDFFFLLLYRWCDQELGKFASTFGGPRILGRLALSPAVKSGGNSSQGTTYTTNSTSTSIPELKENLRKAEEAGDYALAGSLRRKLTKAEESARKEERSSGDTSKSDSSSPRGAENDRQVRAYVNMYWIN